MQGSLVCVGTGMTLGAHLSPIAKSYIEQADVVFSLMSSGITERWVEEMHTDVRSLQPYYQEGKIVILLTTKWLTPYWPKYVQEKE